ncbi:MAG TPA: type II secretion system protein [bacterium]|jgi:Tfp pilus assembly protein PilV
MPTTDERGTSLIEALVAMTVLGVIATSVFGLFLTGQSALRSAQRVEQASLLAQQRLEQIKAAAACSEAPLRQPRAPVDARQFPGFASNIETSERAPGLHEVTVTVFWSDLGREGHVDLTTYVRVEGRGP